MNIVAEGLHRRIEDLRGEVRTIATSAQETAIAVVVARNIADEAIIKVGQVHLAQKNTAEAVAQLVIAETVLSKYYGRTLRWRDALLVVATLGTAYTIAHNLKWIPF